MFIKRYVGQLNCHHLITAMFKYGPTHTPINYKKSYHNGNEHKKHELEK